MPQAPQSHNPHSLPGAASIPLQRRVHRYSPTQHRRGVLTRDGVEDLEDEVRRHASIFRIAAHELAAVGVFGALRTDYLDAVLFLPIEAVLAVKAGGLLGANADAVADPAADSQRGHLGVVGPTHLMFFSAFSPTFTAWPTISCLWAASERLRSGRWREEDTQRSRGRWSGPIRSAGWTGLSRRCHSG